MKRFNVILLLDAAGEHILMCRRVKPPYQGLLNLPGGKLEPGEDGLHAAYRELREETGVTAADVYLHHMMDFVYPAGCSGLPASELQVYVGRLRHPVTMIQEINPLTWAPVTENFFDMTRFSGEGNIGHMLETARRYLPDMLTAKPSEVALMPLSAEMLPVLKCCCGYPEETLQSMLAESLAGLHEGHYYRQFGIQANGAIVGTASLYAREDGCFSEGIEIWPPFRQCGFGAAALTQLAEVARKCGCTALTAQVRTDNVPSLALHARCGFAVTETAVNRRGHEVHAMIKYLESVCHEMNLRPEPFTAIASGRKRYELRLNDEKRQLIHPGDRIRFTCVTDGNTLLVQVTEVLSFPDFETLYAALPLEACGYAPEGVAQASPKDMEAYYPPEKQARYGVMAIGVELC